jgi:SecD/SecF fusion protein
MLFTAGLNFGIDFTGGTVIEVQAKSGTADVGDIRERLNAVGIVESQVQEFGSESEALIRVGTAEGGDTAQTAIVQSAQEALAADYDFRRTEVVGPTVSGELAWAAVIGVLASLFAILVYVWIRFEWQFAVGAIIATINDVILTLGFLAVTQLEFNLSTVAAILTIVGYSLNDTVVIYDRIRENLRRFKKMPIGELLDLSDNEMLARTVMTTLTTLLALLALFIFGGEVIRSFVASMLFGVGVGALSTIFVAAPVLIFFKLRPADFAAKKEDEEAERAGSAAGKA